MRLNLTPKQVDRFWSHVDRRGPDDCWEWQLGRDVRGYGFVKITESVNGRDQYFAHRVAYFLGHGEFPSELGVLHRCDNPPCCNPAHLFVGTQLDNVRDMYEKGRQNRPYGDRIWTTKLTEEDVRAIRSRYRRGVRGCGVEAIARDYGVHHVTINAIVQRRTWKHVE